RHAGAAAGGAVRPVRRVGRRATRGCAGGCMSAQDPLARFVAEMHEPDGPALSAVRTLLAGAGAEAGADAGADATAAAFPVPSEARLAHLRYKPGHSVLARVEGGGQPWWLVVRTPRSADKAAKIRTRAAESGLPLIDA